EEALVRSDYYRKKKEFASCRKGSLRKGIGLSLFFHGGGFTGSGEEKISGKARVAFCEDGLIHILVSSVEMGQGATVMFTSIAADTLGLPVEIFMYTLPDTSMVPDSGPTVASRTTMYVGKFVVEASRKMLNKLMKFASRISRVEVRQLKLKDGWVFCNDRKLYSFHEIGNRYLREAGPLWGEATYYPLPGDNWNEETFSGKAYRSYSWGADVTEVEVDMDTYEIRPLKLTSLAEIGRVINVTSATGQVEGGSLQGLGYAYLEDLEFHEGIYTSGHLSHYHIPTSCDTPDFDVILKENPYEDGPFGAKGLGELPMDGSAPSLVSAVENATGLSITRIPLLPENLHRWRSESACGGDTG
ncbi:MAG TPA: molybdopterin-dependent oxidoreductase, partial [Synergistales bacterium]|nr:molybdopterin-dependent oxidoreductase [Synergistales bacterium]